MDILFHLNIVYKYLFPIRVYIQIDMLFDITIWVLYVNHMNNQTVFYFHFFHGAILQQFLDD